MNTSAVAQATQSVHAFTQEARDAIYHAIFSRRDVRGQFLPTPVPDEVLSRILTAAHHAPSVGFMQPWNFLVVRSPDTKRRVHAAFAKAGKVRGPDDSKPEDRPEPFLALQGRAALPLLPHRGLP